MYGVLFRVQAHPHKRQELIDFLKYDGEFGRDHEPGTLRFEFYQDPNEENAFYVYEAYRNKGAFEEHKKHEPFRQWLRQKSEWLANPEEVLFKVDAIWGPCD
jgi:quinol monooxygenase YgiN